MKAMIIAIQPKWLKMILEGTKKLEFRNWKVPAGTVIYFYESLGKRKPIHLWEDNPLYIQHRWNKNEDMDELSDYVTEGRGLVVAKCVVKEVYNINKDELGFAIVETFNDPDGDSKYIEGNFNYDAFDDSWDSKDLKIWWEEIDADNYKQTDLGYNEQRYALELSEVEEIEPRDITSFVSWSKLNEKRKERNREEDIQQSLRYGDFQQEFSVDSYIDYYGIPKDVNVTVPPQSRTWVYVNE